MRGNLFEEENNNNRKRELLVREIGILLIILSLIIPGIHYYFNYQQIPELREEREKLQEQKQVLSAEHEEYENLLAREEKLNELAEIEFTRYQLAPALAELSRLIPDEVVFNQVNFTVDEMHLSGRAFYEDELRQFADELGDNAFFSLREMDLEGQGDEFIFTMELALETGEVLP